MSKSDLIAIQEMSEKDMDIRAFTAVVSANKTKQGGHLTIGIPHEAMQIIGNEVISGTRTHYIIAYMVNIEQFDKLKNSK